ncbi:MAG: Bax inhibitor-1 family protein [Thermaerobacter sp.]|nr:Bax inhibitor-1 family protein [Thermaerobacter sp.]
MYNRSPYAYPITEGVTGSLMGKTLGVLVLLLVISAVSVGFAPALGAAGMWIGFAGALVGTIMVSRRVNRAGAALVWGIVVAIGMGLIAAPFIWQVALTNPGLLASSFGVLLLAIATSAALVWWLPWDFSRMMPLLFLGLLMLLVTGLLSWVVPGMAGVALSKTYNLIGVLVFIGYLIADFSLMRVRGRTVPAAGAPVMLAVALLVDIINLFLFILRLGRN